MARPTLFEYPPTRSNRAKWALEELGVSYDKYLVSFPSGEQSSPEYRKVHPLGKVPAYGLNGEIIFESIAIVMKLLDDHPEAGLAPSPTSPKRGLYYQWCVFAGSEMDHNLFDVMKHTMHLPNEVRNSEISERGKARLEECSRVISAALDQQDFLLGDSFSGADIAIGYCLNWMAYTGLLKDHPRLVEYYALLEMRPAFERVFTPIKT
ncbi:glutathione S-transferase family protein [uncultured Ruegeria sp.]|uniref:glutathione S-transferase family protein n=1 Tax=uncultured Ruegeria sp. TaxID=259304 RepID=UPI002612BCF0|nr:glutathione S-transferase family protein [uncultured Ruegeria sp.]